MNVSQMIQQIKSLTDYFPETVKYSDRLVDQINNAYFEVWNKRQWTFAEKTEFLSIYPELNYERTNATLGVTDGSRNMIFSTAISTLEEDGAYTGQPIEIDGREYTIDQIVSSTVIRLREPFRGTSDAANENWKIKARFYILPANLVDILDLQHSDAPVPGITNRGKLVAIPAHVESQLGLDLDRTSSYAEGYVPVSPLIVPPGEKLEVDTQFSALASQDFPDNTYMEFCWAFEINGLVGPLSESAIKQTGVGGGSLHSFTLRPVGHDGQPVVAAAYSAATDTHKNPYEGMRKVFFYNQNFDRTLGERLGQPVWREIKSYGGGIPYAATQYDHEPLVAGDEDSSADVQFQIQCSSGNPRYTEVDGQYLRIRPYPRIDGWEKEYDAVTGPPVLNKQYFRQLTLRYRYKPEPLAALTDSPDMPYEFHQLVLYTTLHQIFLMHNNISMAQLYERRSDKLVKDLEKRYTNHQDVLFTRGQFGYDPRRVAYWDVNSLQKLN